jgi:hypothetical protein
MISRIRSAAPIAVITMLSHAGAPARPSQFQSFNRGAAKTAAMIATTRFRPSSMGIAQFYHIRFLFALETLEALRNSVKQELRFKCSAGRSSARHPVLIAQNSPRKELPETPDCVLRDR